MQDCAMRMTARLARYTSAWTRFDQIRRFTLEDHSLEELLDLVFTYAYGFFEPIQIRDEILEALRQIQVLRPRYVVELGTAHGGTLLLWSRVAHPEATLITIDLPGGQFGGGSSILRVPLIRRLGLPRQKIHIIRADSHSGGTLEQTRTYLDGHAADFLFIDADHTESGVRADYRMYSPLVRPGGIIGFHDIAIQSPEYGVQTLWKELSERGNARAILAKPNPFGIGLLYC
jgi:cephalosporin hydroxylase